MGFDVAGAKAAGYSDDEINQHLQARQSPEAMNIDVASGGGLGDRLMTSFKMTNAGKVGYLENKYGKGNVKLSPDGEIVFKNPQTSQWTQLDEKGFGIGDIADFAGDVPGMVGGAIGASVGASAAGVGSVPGAAAGSAAGNVLKQGISKLLPGDDQMSIGDRVFSTGVDAAFGAGGQKLGNVIGTALSTRAARQLAQNAPAPVVNIQIVEKALDGTGVDWRSLSSAAQQKARDYAARAIESGSDIDPKMLTNKAILESLPVPINYPTKGQLSRDFYQQQNENMLADIPVIGRGLRDAFEGQQQTLASNLDELAARTGAVTANPRQVGQNVQGNLLGRYDAAKAATRQAYQDAEAMYGNAPAQGSQEIIDWLNKYRGFPEEGGMVNVAKNLGIVTEDAGGNLIPGIAPMRNLSELRSIASAKSKTNGAFGQFKGLVDDVFDNSGIDAYTKAAALRRAQGQTFEQGHKVVSDLVKTRPKTKDLFTNPEDLFNRVVLNGSRDDVRALKTMLLKRDDPAMAKQGWQALKDLRGRTVDFLKENAVQDLGGGQVGFKVGGLESAIKKVGQENLEELLGKAGAKEINTLLEASRLINRSKPNRTVGSATAPRLAQMALSVFENLGRVPGLGSAGTAGKYAVHAMQGANAMRQPTEELIAKEAQMLYGKDAGLQTLANLLRTGALGVSPQ